MKLFVIHTSEANDNLFFSPPEIPRSLPGIPMYVSAHFDRLSFGKKTSGSESAYSLDSTVRVTRFGREDCDDSSILGYQTFTSLSTLFDICRCSSPALRNWKKVLRLPCQSTASHLRSWMKRETLWDRSAVLKNTAKQLSYTLGLRPLTSQSNVVTVRALGLHLNQTMCKVCMLNVWSYLEYHFLDALYSLPFGNLLF